ncbi:3801_t:CDS:1, partial [Funneliformis geosporum]
LYTDVVPVIFGRHRTSKSPCLGLGPILDIFWPELTRDMASINTDKKSQT